MKRRPWLTLKLEWPGTRITKAGREFQRALERDLAQIKNDPNVVGMASTSEPATNAQEEIWTDDYSFELRTKSSVDLVGNKIVEAVRKRGLKFQIAFYLEKVIHNEKPQTWTQRIFANRRSRWRESIDDFQLRPAKKTTTAYPDRIRYLAQIAQRCNEVGGSDQYGLLLGDGDYESFLTNLAPADQKELIETYQTIVKQKDNDWILNWLRETDEWPGWAAEVSWLFSLLDRLRENGFLAGTSGNAKRTVLQYWDDALEGKPRMVGASKKK